MPLKDRNTHPDSVDLLEDFKAQIKEGISVKQNTSKL